MNEPKLRFKADDGNRFPEWEEKTVGDITIELQDYKSFNSGYPLMTSSRTGLMMQNEFRSKSSTDDGTAIFSIVPRGVATYRHMSDDDIFHFNINNLVDKGLVSKEYPVFNTKDNYNLYLLVEYLNSSRSFLNFCKAQKKGGTRTRLYFKVLKDFKLNIPSFPEQQKIAEFLSTVDTVIEKQKETVSTWEECKKGVMQKLFSQEVRFKADDGSDFPQWEEKKLKNILKEYKEYSAKDGSYEHVSLTKEGVVPKSERYERDFLVKDVEKKYRITRLGDICYNPANLKFGVICRNKYGDGIFSPIYVTFKVCKDMLPEFVEALVTRCDFIEHALKYQQGTVYERMSVSPDDLLSIKVMVPCHAEQRKIVDCLSSLDEVIEKQKATLAAWKEMKKGLLQQMFV